MYRMQDWEECENKVHALPWELVRLCPVKAGIIRRQIRALLEEEDESQYGGSPNTLATNLEIGMNFAVQAGDGNDEEATYYILDCKRKALIVAENLDCIFGNNFEVGDRVVQGIYYAKWGRHTNGRFVLMPFVVGSGQEDGCECSTDHECTSTFVEPFVNIRKAARR